MPVVVLKHIFAEHCVPKKLQNISNQNYRIYSRISRGFLDNFFIKNWVGRGIRI